MSGLGRVLRAAVVCAVVSVAIVGPSAGGPLASVASAAGPQPQGAVVSPVTGPPGYAMAEPVAGSAVQSLSRAAPFASPLTPINATYVHAGALSPAVDLPPGNGDVMPT